MQHTNPTSWIPIRRKPKYDGPYECRTASGAVSRVEFHAGSWKGDLTTITHWRGRYTVLSKDEVSQLQRVLGEFRNQRGQPHTRNAAGEAALRLARYKAGPTRDGERGNRRKACELFLIAHSLGAPLEEADLAYQSSRWPKVSKDAQEKTHKKVDEFLGVVKASI